MCSLGTTSTLWYVIWFRLWLVIFHKWQLRDKRGNWTKSGTDILKQGSLFWLSVEIQFTLDSACSPNAYSPRSLKDLLPCNSASQLVKRISFSGDWWLLITSHVAMTWLVTRCIMSTSYCRQASANSSFLLLASCYLKNTKVKLIVPCTRNSWPWGSTLSPWKT